MTKVRTLSLAVLTLAVLLVLGLVIFNTHERPADYGLPAVDDTLSNKTAIAKRSLEKSTHRLIRAKACNTLLPQAQRKDLPDKTIKRYLQEAIDSDQESQVLSLCKMAINSENHELRMTAVDALGWYGDKFVPELLAFFNDPDDTVAAKAFMYVDQAIDMIEDEQMIANLVKLTMDYATEEDQAVSLLAKLEGVTPSIAATAIADLAIKAQRDSVLFELLGNEYEYITGCRLTTPGIARVWARKYEHNKP